MPPVTPPPGGPIFVTALITVLILLVVYAVVNTIVNDRHHEEPAPVVEVITTEPQPQASQCPPGDHSCLVMG